MVLDTLEPGDTITWTTKLGTRTYQVVSVEKVLETDTSGTATTSDNRITLFTCVRDSAGIPLVCPGCGMLETQMHLPNWEMHCVFSLSFCETLTELLPERGDEQIVVHASSVHFKEGL